MRSRSWLLRVATPRRIAWVPNSRIRWKMPVLASGLRHGYTAPSRVMVGREFPARGGIVLDDLLKPGLRLIVCGTAAGAQSARLGFYYAGPGNKFWRVLAEVGLTPRQLAPSECALLPTFGIGLTDLVKDQSGSDSAIQFSRSGSTRLRDKILEYRPQVLCFNGKRSALEFLGTPKVGFGMQPERIGVTRLFIAPSTSGAANGSWSLEPWLQLAAWTGVEPSPPPRGPATSTHPNTSLRS
jgi:TDG/mug DNA glycosylase family protein